jgi:hypothetical protein
VRLLSHVLYIFFLFFEEYAAIQCTTASTSSLQILTFVLDLMHQIYCRTMVACVNSVALLMLSISNLLAI